MRARFQRVPTTGDFRKSQQGYVLFLMLLFMTLIIIGLAAAVPMLATQIKRDRENELIHRGEQYERAVRRYYKKLGRYPTRIEELENTNNIRFLRKRYKDPFSSDGSWRIVRYGEVQLGQQQGSTGSVPASAQQPQSAMSGGLFGSSSSPTSQTDASSQVGGRSGQATPASGQSPSGGGSSFGSTGQAFGGGAMMGVASKSEAEGLHEFNKKRRYKDWLFIYDPQQDRGQGLLKGPYNPNAYVGQFGSQGIGTPAGTTQGQGTSSPGTGGMLPNIPGVSGQGGILNNSPSQQTQPQTTPQQ